MGGGRCVAQLHKGCCVRYSGLEGQVCSCCVRGSGVDGIGWHSESLGGALCAPIGRRLVRCGRGRYGSPLLLALPRRLMKVGRTDGLK